MKKKQQLVAFTEKVREEHVALGQLQLSVNEKSRHLWYK